MGWEAFLHDGGQTKGLAGTEGGTILADEEYENAARITLEENAQNGAVAAITCGVYGWMVHTRFFSDALEARQAFGEMKANLAQIVDDIPTETEPNWERHIPAISAAIHTFIERFPT